MTILRVALIASLGLLLMVSLFWLSRMPSGADSPGNAAKTPPPSQPPFRIGLVPERDIFAQHDRYQALAQALSLRLGRPVELVTLNTYNAVLQEFRERKVEAAFVGSLVAVLAMERLEAQVLVKPENLLGQTSYRGVIIVREDSPIHSVSDLRGCSIAAVRTTTAGSLFSVWLMATEHLLGTDKPPPLVWVGTHDDVVQEVIQKNVDAGAVKDQRLEEILRAHPDWKIRRLAVSQSVPENGLILRADLVAEWGPKLSQVLLSLADDEPGRQTLAKLQVRKFVLCQKPEYAAIYQMISQLGREWALVGVEGPPPSRPQVSSPK